MTTQCPIPADYLKKATGKDYAVEAGTEGKGAILLKLGMESENPEAYQLSVNADGVTIAAPTEAGVFYGIQTLRKSIPVAIGTTPSLPLSRLATILVLVIVVPILM